VLCAGGTGSPQSIARGASRHLFGRIYRRDIFKQCHSTGFALERASQWHYTTLVGSTAEPEFGDVLDDFGNLPGGVDAAIYTENTFVPDAERIGRQHVR
jgi:hypothetical protein